MIENLPLAMLAAALIAGVAWRARALTLSGAAAAFVVGSAAFGFGGFAVAAPLVAFFVSGSLLSRIGDPHAAAARAVADKGATRDAVQVIANGGAAAACAVVSGLLAHASPAWSARWLTAAACALAVAAADTWAAEIGILSPVQPRSIATLRPVRPGVSGGVTLLGFTAALAGGALIGAVAGLFAPQLGAGRLIVQCAGIGFAGSMLDSVLGATLQGSYSCDRCGQPCEGPLHSCGSTATHVAGLRTVDNDFVNAFSTAAGAAFSLLLFSPAR